MYSKKYLDLINTFSRMSETRDIESLIYLVLKETKIFYNVQDIYIVLSKNQDQLSEILPSGKIVQGLKLSEIKLPVITGKKDKYKLTRLKRTDPFAQELEINSDSILFSPFYSVSGFNGGIVLIGEIDYSSAIELQLLESIGEHISISLENILYQDKLKKRIDYLTDYDDLVTKLPNRKSFNKVLAESINNHRSRCNIALFFIDLDNLKYVNRTFGYSNGDQLLFLISQRMVEFVRNKGLNSFLARMGGDEFVLLLPDVDNPEHIETIAKELLLEIKRSIKLENSNYSTTASIGIGIYPVDGVSAADVLFCAEQAMFSAKEKGKDMYVFYDRLLQ